MMRGGASEIRPADEAAIWAVAHRLKIFSFESLMAETGRSKGQIQRLIKRWTGAHGLDLVRTDADNRKWWGVRPDQVAVPAIMDASGQRTAITGNPQDGSGTPHRNMWRQMIRMRAFSPTDIAAMSNTETIAVSVDDARSYCQLLLRFGYLAVEKKARPGVVEARYRLINNTGPEAPQMRRIGVLVDPNLGEFIYPEGARA
jgi:hypothetical protein